MNQVGSPGWILAPLRVGRFRAWKTPRLIPYVFQLMFLLTSTKKERIKTERKRERRCRSEDTSIEENEEYVKKTQTQEVCVCLHVRKHKRVNSCINIVRIICLLLPPWNGYCTVMTLFLTLPPCWTSNFRKLHKKFNPFLRLSWSTASRLRNWLVWSDR